MSQASTPALSMETILTLAERESGAHGLADDGLRQRVAAMIGRINAGGPYSADRTDAMRRQLQGVLVARLRIAADRKQFPAIADEKIERPIFIIGFPRSGTTLLHSLLAEDPEVLAPQSWHSHAPSPPPGAGPVCSGRIASAQRAVEEWMDFCPGARVMHPYIDKGAYQTIEDEELFTLDFRNVYPTRLYRVPTLPGMVALGSDAADAFRFHREVLQHFQWNTGKHRWVCKGPTAQHHLEALLKVYPDALCVWAHRPLGEIYASNVAFRSVVYDAINGRPIDWSSQAREAAQGMKAAVDRAMANALIDDPRVIHIPFRELSADPIAVVRKVYADRGLTVSAAYETQLRAWLDDPENRVDRYGRYPYSYEALGLDKEWIESLFADYSKRFGLHDHA
jgi:Sulfotransferase family